MKHYYCKTEMKEGRITHFKHAEIEQEYFCPKCKIVVEVIRPLTEKETKFRENWERNMEISYASLFKG